MKKLSILLGLVFLCAPLYARESAHGYCEQGGHLVVTQGLNSSNDVQQSFKSCTVTVYDAGTATLATIYSDNSGTVKGNPFTSDSDGWWSFYADNGRYDVHFSGSDIGTPYTQDDYLLCDPADPNGSFTCTGTSTGLCPLGPTDTRYVDSGAGSDSNIGRNWCSAYATEGAAITALTATGGWIYVAPDYSGAVPSSVPSNIHILQTLQFDAFGSTAKRFSYPDWSDTTEDHPTFAANTDATVAQAHTAFTQNGPFGNSNLVSGALGNVTVPSAASAYPSEQAGVAGIVTSNASSGDAAQVDGLYGNCYNAGSVGLDCTGVVGVAGNGTAGASGSFEGGWFQTNLGVAATDAMGIVIRSWGSHMPSTEYGSVSGRANAAIDIPAGNNTAGAWPTGLYFENSAINQQDIAFTGNVTTNNPHGSTYTFDRWKDYYAGYASSSSPYDKLSVVKIGSGSGAYQTGNYIFTNSANSSEAVLPINYSGVFDLQGTNAATFSATPTFNRAIGSLQTITLTANVTSSTLSNCAAGQTVIFDVIENGTGGFTFAWPSNFHGAGSITTTANEHNRQMFYCDGTNVWSISAIQSGT